MKMKTNIYITKHRLLGHDQNPPDQNPSSQIREPLTAIEGKG